MTIILNAARYPQYFAAKSCKEDDVRRALDETPSMIKWLQKKVDNPCKCLFLSIYALKLTAQDMVF
jgi:hypothetical protein